MPASVKLRLGAKVACSDGPAGTLARFIIDLDSGHVTHLDVAHHTRAGGHLVPIAGVAEGGDEIHLSSTSEQFSGFQADETYADVAPARSYFDAGALVQMSPIGFAGLGMFGAWGAGGLQPIREQVTPKDETSVEGHERVHSSDGHHVGHIDGLVVEPIDGRIAYVLLAEGHIFNKREVAIPSDAVLGIAEDRVSLSLTRDEIEALPAV